MDDTPATSPPPVRHAIVELMGHRRVGARVDEIEFCGAKMLRLVVLTAPPFEQIVSPQALYAVTFCTEDQAAKVNTPWTQPEEMRARLGPGAVIDHAAADTSGCCIHCGAPDSEPCTPDCPNSDGSD